MALVLLIALIIAPVVAQGSGKTFVVTSISDSGTGSLRQTLLDGQNGDTITFDPSVFSPTNPDTIALNSPLPALLQGNLVIDASDAGVVIDGSRITTPEAYGFSISSNNNTIRGLQIMGFTQACIGLSGSAQYNTIGGDRDTGTGLLGQGNLITGNGTFGIGLWGEGTSFNTIKGNFIGTDVSGTTVQGSFSGGVFLDGADYNLVEDNLIGGFVDNGVHLGSVSAGHNTVRGNYIGTNTSGVIQLASSSSYGVSIDNSGFNVVGPANVIAHNGRAGIAVSGEESVGNLITQNSIYNNGGVDHNGGVGIELWYGGNLELAAPAIFDFDLQAGTVTGVACASCTVEVFSDNADEGEVYEGQTTADPTGLFSFTKGAPFSRSRLTATATDTNGNTSQFSVYTPDVPSRNVILQEGNGLPKTRFQPKRSGELIDNRIGSGWTLPWILDLGVKRAGLAVNDAEWSAVNWNLPEFEVPPELDNYATTLAANGFKLSNLMVFWDTANHPDGWEEPEGYSRFQSEEEIQRYLEYVQFNVRHFKDRVQYYELWLEPDNSGFRVQHIRVPDYINLVKRVVPVIRQEYPEARIVIGSVVLQHAQDYLFGILKSDEIMPLVDVVNWHPFFGASPAYEDTKDYYDKYPSIVQAIKDTAYAHGFRGEYEAHSITWPSHEFNIDHPLHSEIQCAKYYARSIVLHRGMDVLVHLGFVFPSRVIPYATVRNLCTVMAGTTTDSIAVQIQSDAADLRNYSFSLPDGDKMIALWTDGVAVDYDPGVAATLTLTGLSDKKMTGIDVLTGVQQEMTTVVENGNLVIRDLLVKDYPIILRTASPTPTGIQKDPAVYKLGNNYPNPFNPSTSIEFQIPAHSEVSIKIYNLQGQKIRDVVEKDFEPGFHKVEWNGLDNRGKTVATGMYLIHMKSGNFVKTKKCLLLR